MTERSYRIFFEDLLGAINKIERYIKGFNKDMFLEDEIIADAVLRNLEIIGEAAKNIPEMIRDEHPQIPWKRMIGLRNIAIHRYFSVDLDIVWEIITKNLPDTKPDIEKIVEKFKE